MIDKGSLVVYRDIAGRVTKIEGDKAWVLTRDLMLIGVPLEPLNGNRNNLLEVKELPPPTPEEHRFMEEHGMLPKERKFEPKLFLKAKLIQLPKARNRPGGVYRIIAGGIGVGKLELLQALRGVQTNTRLTIVTWNNGEGHFVIEVPANKTK